MDNNESRRARYPVRSRPHNLRTWMESRKRRKEKEQKKRFMKTVIVRCHYCDCEYDTRRYSKCYKCGASERDLNFAGKIRRSWHNFWRWFH